MIGPILARRSIRTYTAEPVTEEEIRTILDAAMAAPSASDKKPWHFIVVRDRERLNQLSEYGSHWQMLQEASLGIVVCGDTDVSEKYWVQDASAATENILLAVSMMGLGAVWLGCHPRPERVEPVKKLLGIPEDVEPLAVISIGHPGEEKEPRTQYDESKVHRETW